MQWDQHHCGLHGPVARRRICGGAPETTYYVYDAVGQRVRKVTERQNGSGRTRRNGSISAASRSTASSTAIGANIATLERETLHVMDDKQRIALVETRTSMGER